jgi:hypothetical protein
MALRGGLDGCKIYGRQIYELCVMTPTHSVKRIALQPASRPASMMHQRAGAGKQERRRVVVIGCVGLMAATFGTAAVVALGTLQLPAKFASTSSVLEEKPRNAKVIDELSRQCRNFDNQTGRMTQGEPCEVVPRDAQGVPIPVGTIHRLDSISKSFSNH